MFQLMMFNLIATLAEQKRHHRHTVHSLHR
ncbi:hypothetical protein LZ22198_MCBDPFMK_01697 [Levilactobacillus zymae]